MAAGSIVVDLLMRTGSFETDTERARKSLKKFESTVDSVAKTVVLKFAVVQTAVTALTIKTMNAAKEIERFSTLANTSAESFQLMAAGASSFGVQQDKLADILKDVQDKVGDFLQTGGGPLKDFFEKIAPKIGVTAEQFRSLSGKDALQLYVSSLEKANLSQSEMVFYMEAIASDSTLLLPLLQDNGKAMEEFGQKAKATGQIMSDDLLKNSIEFQKNIKQLTDLLTGLSNEIVGAILPSLIKLTDQLIAGLQATNGFVDAIKTLGFAKPFEDAGKGAKYYREELQRLEAERNRLAKQEVDVASIFSTGAAEAFARSGADIEIARAKIEQEIKTAQKQLAYYNALQLREVQRSISPTDQSLAESRRLGMALPAALPAVKIPKSAGAPDDFGKQLKAEEEARRRSLLEDEMEIFRERNKIMDEGRRVYEQTRTPVEKLNIEYERLNKLLEAGAINQDTYSRAVFDAMEAFDATNKKMEESNKLAQELGMTFTSAFEDAVVAGKSLSDTLRGLAQDLLRIATRKLITEPLGAAFTSALGGMFGGAKAGGGDVIEGRAYLVGENGPEMFTPRTTGTITPSGATGGATIVQNINVTTGVQQTVRAEILSLMPQIAASAKAAVADAKLRGGAYAAALR